MINDIDKIMKNVCSLDTTFVFGCKGCGKCCHHRTDIILNPRDIFNISKYLYRTPIEIITRYCELHIGPSSGLPLVRIKPIGGDDTCPFLRKKKCIIHKAKPVVCAIYPLGRFVKPEKMELEYILQPISCGNKNESYTVKEWLSKFGYENDEEFFLSHQNTMNFLAIFLNENKEKLQPHAINNIHYLISSLLYLEYNTSKDFLPQYNNNIEKLKIIIEDLQKLNL